MASVYYSPSLTTKWDDTANWFSDPTFTTPLGALPQTGDDLYINGTIDGYDTTPPSSPFGSGTFTGNGIGGMLASFCSVTLSFTGDVVFNNGYALSGFNLSLTANNVTFNGLSAIGGGAGSYYYPVTVTASNITFNDNSYNYTYAGSLYGNVVLNNNAALYDVACYNDVTMNNSTVWNKSNPMLSNTCYGVLYLKDLSSVSDITLHNNVIIYYPGTASISNYTFITSPYQIYYTQYPILYLYNSSGSSDWSLLSDWYVDAAHTLSSYDFPGISTDVIVDTTVSFGGVTNTCNNLSISNGSINIPIYVVTLATFNSTSYLDTLGNISGSCLFKDSSHNDGTTGPATFGVDNGTDIAYNNGIVYTSATFYASTYANTSTYYGPIDFYDNSYTNTGAAITNDNTISFYNNATHNASSVTAGFMCSFNDTSTNLGSCDTVEYNDSSEATSATYATDLNITISDNPVNSYTMDTFTKTYTFTRGGGGGGGINGSSILGIL